MKDILVKCSGCCRAIFEGADSMIAVGDQSGWVLQNLLTVLASTGSLVATIAVVYSLTMLRNQLRLQVFLEYTRRFDEIEFPALTHSWLESR